MVKHRMNQPNMVEDLLTEFNVDFESVVATNVCYPDPDEFDGFIFLGSGKSVNDKESGEEIQFMESLITKKKPVLGICFGAQLMAKALGAEVGSCTEYGNYTIKLNTGGQKDPLLTGFPKEFNVFQVHDENFAIPKEAQRLDQNKRCNQIIRFENALGMQFHLEYTKEAALYVSAKEDCLKGMAAVGIDADHFLESFEIFKDNYYLLLRRLLRNFIAEYSS